MRASPGCDMASFHASYRAKANLELIKSARFVTVNLHVISAPANYLVLSMAAMHRWEAMSGITVLFMWGNNNKVKLCLWVFIQTHFHCWVAVRVVPFSSDQGTQWRETVVKSFPIQTALSGGHQASMAAWPLHGDSAGFNYPQLCFISLPSWALCPSVLCKYAAFTLKSRWDKQTSVCTHWACTGWRAATQTKTGNGHW